MTHQDAVKDRLPSLSIFSYSTSYILEPVVPCIDHDDDEIYFAYAYDDFLFNKDKYLHEAFATDATTTESTNGSLAATLMMALRIQGHESTRLLRVLLDSGSDRTFFSSRCLPPGACPTLLPSSVSGSTLAGLLTSNRTVRLQEVLFPEFTKSKRFSGTEAFVFDGPCPYDVILGSIDQRRIGINLQYSTGIMQWYDIEIPMKEPGTWNNRINLMMALLNDQFDDDDEETFGSYCECFATEILEAKYEAHDPDAVAQQQTHLTTEQRQDLADLFRKYGKLFSGQLGHYPHRQVHLELKEGAKPVRQRPYSVARTHLQVFKEELYHLVNIGVLERCGASEWQAPTFIVPKKDGRVRWVSDFRELNKVLRRRAYPLPRIQDILKRRTGYEFFSKLDISMQYYTFELDDESKDLCVIATPFGLFRYRRLPMGISCSPDFAQEIMEDIFRDLEAVEVFIDDIGCFDSSWKQHLQTLDTVLHRLQENNFTVNPLKCEWCVKETDWPGHWLTPVGLKPWKKKIQAILNLAPPSNIKELRSFIGAVNFYRDMFPHRAHLMAPLTDATNHFVWEPAQQQAFDAIKALIAEDCLLRYPDPNQRAVLQQICPHHWTLSFLLLMILNCLNVS